MNIYTVLVLLIRDNVKPKDVGMKKSTKALFKAALFNRMVEQPAEKAPVSLAIRKGIKSLNNLLPKHFISSQVGVGGEENTELTNDGYAYLGGPSLLATSGPSSLCVAIRKKLPRFDLDVKFECDPGTLTVIVGPSGAGKTTLIRSIAGLERPDSGSIVFGGVAWMDSGKDVFLPPQKRGLGLVFQEYTLFPHLNVRKNVAFAARRPERVSELLDMFGIRHLEEKKPSVISGGERQRAAFCQALAREPVLLLLDEPFSALDVATRADLRHQLKDLKTELGIPILHVTHDLGEADFLGDFILPIVEGEISPQWLDEQYRHLLMPVGGSPARYDHKTTAGYIFQGGGW
jgi:molybdate transport system ATP-binding protein